MRASLPGATAIALYGLLAVSCGGGGGSSSTPSVGTPTTPSVPAAPSNAWSIAGTLSDTAAHQPIPGATITPTWDLASASSAADGTYTLASSQNPPSSPYKLSVSGTGLVTRELWVNWQRGARTDVALDAIRDAPPFSMVFYRQFVRGTYDTDGMYSVLRWNVAPKFYLRTVDQTGKAIEPEVLAVVRDALFRATPAFTGGKLTTAAVETGTETRAEASGFVTVEILRDPNEADTCGFAYVGANPGSITLYNDVCSCGSNKIPGAVVMHEVGHTLGFFHVSDKNSVMYPFAPGNCPPGDLSASEKYHAAIAYSRPRGNVDPDTDPSSSTLLTSASSPRILIK